MTDQPFRGVEVEPGGELGDTGPAVENTLGGLVDELPDDVRDGDADPGPDDVDHPAAKDIPDDPNDTDDAPDEVEYYEEE